MSSTGGRGGFAALTSLARGYVRRRRTAAPERVGPALLALLLVAAAVAAQTAPPPSTQPRVYLPDDFAQFAPRTALDMLRRVPGFTIREESQERGLGEASGNVLVNGERTSGKSNDVLAQLGRIPAQDVVRIEVVDAATLDVPGLTGQVADVLVRASTVTGQWAYRPEFRSYYTDPLLTRFELSVSGTAGPVEYTLGVDNAGNRSGAGGPTWVRSPDGGLIEERAEEWRGNTDRPQLSGRFALDGPGTAKGNLSVLYGRLYFDYLETGTRITAGGEERARRVAADEHGPSFEVGGDYELDLGHGRLKLIGVARGSDHPNEITVVDRPADGTPAVGFRTAGVTEERETIARAEYRWSAGGAEWQVSTEAAFNALDSTLRLYELQPDGAYLEIPLPGGTAEVEEDRYELVASHGRAVSETVTVKVSAGGEYSRLTQVGAGGTTRTFYRPKGELSAAWAVSPRTDLNVKLARRVGQLNFLDFLASVDIQNDIENAANPDLVPEQSWDLDLEWAHDLAGLGSGTVRLYGRLIDDIIDYVPIGESGQAPGNLDQAVVYGIEARGTFELERLGWRGARLDLEAQLQDSEVEDPLTGETRHISDSLLRWGSLAIRHDVPGTPWAWGAGGSYHYAALSYRLTEVGRLWEGPVFADVYVEHKDVLGLIVRVGLANALDADSMWDRRVYTGRRTGPVAFVEERDRRIGPIYVFQVRGTF